MSRLGSMWSSWPEIWPPNARKGGAGVRLDVNVGAGEGRVSLGIQVHVKERLGAAGNDAARMMFLGMRDPPAIAVHSGAATGRGADPA